MSVGQRDVLDDRYVLNDLVGAGGMADVYRATDRLLHRQVAVKLLRETSSEPHRGRFVDEARVLASLNHPGLVTLLDAGFQGDRPYLVMELAEGSTLSARIAADPLSPAEAARVGAELADALAYAHAAGVVHRDVKPSNVLLCEDERVLLADFGIARLVGAAEHHTRTGEAIGSPAYLAPEQVAGEELTAALDVYSLGLVLLEALTGVRAYPGTPVEAAVARLSADPTIPDGVEEHWHALIESMTARDPASRPAAAQVASTLRGWAGPAGPGGIEPIEGATRVLDLGQVTAAITPTPTAVPGPGPVRNRGPRRIDQRVMLAVVGLLAATLVVALLLARPNASDPEVDAVVPDVPAGVPAELEGPLGDLHRAIDGDRR